MGKILTFKMLSTKKKGIYASLETKIVKILSFKKFISLNVLYPPLSPI